MSFPQSSSKSMYHTSAAQKMHSREAAKQFKNSSPRVHLLREKCRKRIQDARRTRFDGTRNIEETNDGLLINKILHEELSEMDSDLSLEAEVLNELRDEMSQWLLKQQEEEHDYFTQLDENNIVCCPLCLKSCLDQCDAQLFKCQCGAMFKYSGTLSDLYWDIKKVVSRHEQLCDETPCFFIEQLPGGLNVMCETCNYFYSFV